ncbi:MAG: Rrf2 family transcriptional regulator [Terriglobia bacterium]
MIFSRATSYAIRALTYLATQPPGKLTGVREISDHVRIPSPYLSKVLLELRRGRLLRSYKGIGGGYELAQPPNKICLFNVIECIDGTPFGTCILEDRECSAGHTCAMHDSWDPVRTQLLRFLQAITLEQLVEQLSVPLPSEASPRHIHGLTGSAD